MSEWFGTLPERWERKRIGALLQQRREKNNPVQTDFILSLSAAHGIVPYAERETRGNKSKSDLTTYAIARQNDLVVNCMNVIIGSSGVTKWDGAISPVYYALYPRKDNLNIRYYEHIFRSPEFYRSLRCYAKGILEIRLRIAMESLNNVLLPLPPRTEQDQIVRFLDWKVSQINKLINAKKKQIGLLQEQKQAMINEAVTRGGEGWRDISLGNLGDFRKGFGGSRADDAENGVACIRYGDIYRSGVLSLTNPITRISKEASISYARVYKSEVLFALSGETKEEIGQALINNIDEDAWCSGDAAIFTANNEVLPHFLIYALRCPYIVAQRASLAKGDIIVHISTSALRQLRVIVPPISEQETIIADLNKKCDFIERAVEIENNQIYLLHEYRTRLISDVVTGKMDVRGVEVPQYEAVEEALEDEPLDENDEVVEGADE